ncbi:accessory gene regulator ArgB-like protein [Cohnella boryungensis]|uniref:Accessory gene regulator ArgB-like protein n=1 Tax=Cohnella boryungensis TaxID=768479 RepID=A0ABV8SBV8_9BACL
MINKVSYSLASYIKREVPENTPSIAVMSYALYIIVHSLMTISLILIFSLLFDSFLATLTALLYFMALRIFAGGYHLHNSWLCTILTVIVVCGSPFVQVNDTMLIAINLVNTLLVAIYAPRNFKGYARIPERYYPLMKIIALLIVMSNFYWTNPVFTLVSLCHSLFLIPKQSGGTKE